MKSVKRILTAIGLLVLVVFGITIYNETTQFVRFVAEQNETAGRVALIALCALYALLFLVPIVSILRYKRTPELPEEETGAAYEAHRKALLQSLKTNRAVKLETTFSDEKDTLAQIHDAQAILNTKANTIIKKEATSVFLTTAVSQNGSLDSLFMIATLTKMIWRMINLYEVRPSARRIVDLYANVAGTVILARSIEDMDLIEEQIEPLLASLLGASVVTLVPGAQTLTNLVVSSITEGAVNTLLTLRVGAITRGYLTALTEPDRGKLRRNASLEAASLLGSILKDNTIGIVKAFGRATKSATKATLGI